MSFYMCAADEECPKRVFHIRAYCVKHRRQADKAISRRRYLGRHGEATRIWLREQKLTKPEKFLWAAARYRCNQSGVKFSIKLEDVTIPSYCPYLKIKLVWAPGTRYKRAEDAPTLDRIDTTKGYVPGNVEVISWRANRVKSNLTLPEMRLMAQAFLTRVEQEKTVEHQ